MRRLIIVEPVARSAVWSRRLAVFALATAGVAIALSRAHTIEPSAALTVFGGALAFAALAILLAFSAATVIWRDGLRGTSQAALGFIIAAGLLAYPVYLAALAFALPKINDVSTDLQSPPPFLLSAKAREARRGIEPPNPSQATIAAQRAAYSDIGTLMVAMDPTEAYETALAAATDLGWSVVDSAPPNLAGDGSAMIEASAKTLFFGFPIDIAIRIRPGATQTAIDVRSISRAGPHDFGANAQRIRRFVAEIRQGDAER